VFTKERQSANASTRLEPVEPVEPVERGSGPVYLFTLLRDRLKPTNDLIKIKNLKLDTNSSILDDSLLKMKISREYSLAFLWGFFLGAGNFYIRVRLDQGFYFVPVFRISQIENS
jgi:hypothetical protein